MLWDILQSHYLDFRAFFILESDCDARTFWNVSSHRISIEGPLCWWASLTSPIATWVAISCNLHIFRWFISKHPIPPIATMTSKVLKMGGYTFQLLLNMAFEDSLVVSILYEVWSRKTGETEAEFVSAMTVGQFWQTRWERSGLQSENPCWFSNDFPMACDRGKIEESLSKKRCFKRKTLGFKSFSFWIRRIFGGRFFRSKKVEHLGFPSPLTHPKFNITLDG